MPLDRTANRIAQLLQSNPQLAQRLRQMGQLQAGQAQRNTMRPPTARPFRPQQLMPAQQRRPAQRKPAPSSPQPSGVNRTGASAPLRPQSGGAGRFGRDADRAGRAQPRGTGGAQQNYIRNQQKRRARPSRAAQQPARGPRR